jgi:hypothetical protein
VATLNYLRVPHLPTYREAINTLAKCNLFFYSNPVIYFWTGLLPKHREYLSCVKVSSLLEDSLIFDSWSTGNPFLSIDLILVSWTMKFPILLPLTSKAGIGLFASLAKVLIP